jgi:hypothetical protein
MITENFTWKSNLKATKHDKYKNIAGLIEPVHGNLCVYDSWTLHGNMLFYPETDVC